MSQIDISKIAKEAVAAALIDNVVKKSSNGAFFCNGTAIAPHLFPATWYLDAPEFKQQNFMKLASEWLDIDFSSTTIDTTSYDRRFNTKTTPGVREGLRCVVQLLENINARSGKIKLDFSTCKETKNQEMVCYKKECYDVATRNYPRIPHSYEEVKNCANNAYGAYTIYRNSNTTKAWPEITGDSYECYKRSASYNHLEVCYGKETNIKIGLSETNYSVHTPLSTLSSAVGYSFVYTAIPEFVGETAHGFGLLSKEESNLFKDLTNLALVSYTGSLAPLVFCYATEFVGQKLGFKQDVVRVYSTSMAVVMNLGLNTSPLGMAATTTSFLAGKFGLWAAKKASHYLTNQQPENNLRPN